MSKQRRHARSQSSVHRPQFPALGGADVSNAEMMEQLRASRGDRRDRARGNGLFGRLFGRRPTPQPRPVQPRSVDAPTPAIDEPVPQIDAPGPMIDEPTPMLDDPAPVVEQPVTSGPEELPAWAREFSEEEEQAALPTGKEIIEGWEQTSKGNCVTVAAIKAAQKTFGPELFNTKDPDRGIFSAVTPTEEGGMHIVMRDGFELSVSPEELGAAASSSRFKTDVGRKDLLDNANKLYAVAAKRAQLEGNDGYGPNKMSYTRALQSLEDGEHTSHIMEQVGRLGLKDHAKKVPRSELKHYDSTLSSGAGHAYFVSNGDRDYYGKVGPLAGQAYTSRSRGRRGRIIRHPAHSSQGTVLQRKKVAN